MTFSAAERRFLADGPPLARLATVDPEGKPHNVPVGYRYNEAAGTIDVYGRDLADTQKFRNVRHNPAVCLVVDDVLPPWHPRCVMIRGSAQALDDGVDGNHAAVIRITPTDVVSWGLAVESHDPGGA
jgi:pyridoxamine 5'-phosphate oxidase family protein